MTALRLDLDLDRRTLSARAERLAKRPVDRLEAPVATEPLLIFRLGGERFCLRMKAVTSVVPLGNLTHVPAANPNIAGVMVIKGEVHAVFNLNRILGLPEAPTHAVYGDARGYVMVLRLPQVRLGVGVDQIEAIAEADLTAEAASSIDVSAGRRLITTAAGQSLILIEDFERLLAPFIQGDAP